MWRHYGRLNYIDWPDSQVHFDDDRALGLIIDAADLNASDHGIVNYKHRILDLMPTDFKSLMINAFTNTISIRLLLERAQQDQQDIDERVIINSVSDLITNSDSLSIANTFRCLALKYL